MPIHFLGRVRVGVCESVFEVQGSRDDFGVAMAKVDEGSMPHWVPRALGSESSFGVKNPYGVRQLCLSGLSSSPV